jgi:hypothetical protein
MVFPARLLPWLPLVFQCVITLCVTIPRFFFIYFSLRFLVSCVILVSAAQKQWTESEVAGLVPRLMQLPVYICNALIVNRMKN